MPAVSVQPQSQGTSLGGAFLVPILDFYAF